MRVGSEIRAAWLFLACVGCAHDGSSDARRPNVVFVMIDTLRADRLGVLGATRALTPAMDRIAAEGVLFERATAPAPWTQPSIASLFTGLHPTAHGVADYTTAVEHNAPGVASVPLLGAEFHTLAEHLADAGYATAGIVSNRFVLAKFGFAQGFGHFDTRVGSNRTPGSTINAAALAWLDAHDTPQPFFLYLHYMDVHSPYTDDPRFLEPLLREVAGREPSRMLTDWEYRGLGHLREQGLWPGGYERHAPLVRRLDYWEARYDAGVRQIDFHLAQLRRELEARGLWDASLVVVTSDHGESLQEHGFWDHGRTLYEPELHVPLILRCPGRLPAGLRVAERVSLVDLLPTLAEQLGLAPPAGIQGRSLVPLLEGRTLDARAEFAEALRGGTEEKAVYDGAWKLIEALPVGRRPKLFHLDRDPGERANRAGDDPPRLAELRALIESHLEATAGLRPAAPVQRVPLTDADVRRLRALGYID